MPGAPERVSPGTDMAAADESHPSLLPALGTARGWISERPFQTMRTDGLRETGFWFGLTLFASNPEQRFSSSERLEAPEQRTQRGRAFNRSIATGLLGVFISTDRMVERAHNATNRPSRIHVRLYAAQKPSPAALFNQLTPAPASPRHRLGLYT